MRFNNSSLNYNHYSSPNERYETTFQYNSPPTISNNDYEYNNHLNIHCYSNGGNMHNINNGVKYQQQENSINIYPQKLYSNSLSPMYNINAINNDNSYCNTSMSSPSSIDSEFEGYHNSDNMPIFYGNQHYNNQINDYSNDSFYQDSSYQPVNEVYCQVNDYNFLNISNTDHRYKYVKTLYENQSNISIENFVTNDIYNEETKISKSIKSNKNAAEFSYFIKNNVNSIFLNFTIRMLNDPAFKNICFWSKLSWEFVIADPGTFTKYFAKEFKLDSKNVNFSHVSKAYKIVELSTIYGQLIITRIKSKRNTWKLFPDHYGVGYPSLKNAGDSSLAGTILIGEEQKFLTRLKKKITKEIKTDKKKKNPCDNNIYKYPHIDVKRLKMDGQK